MKEENPDVCVLIASGYLERRRRGSVGDEACSPTGGCRWRLRVTLLPRDFPKYPRRENLDFTSSPYLILRRTWLTIWIVCILANQFSCNCQE